MQISGFTFIKNAITLGHPIRESIQSIAPFCDEVIINVGHDQQAAPQDDGTYQYLRDVFTEKKYRFIRSWWDPSLRKDGLILSQQTNLALEQCRGKYCQYIQGDEAVHEEDFIHIQEGIKSLEKSPGINGLIFHYLHFYGSARTIKCGRTTYRREVRLIRNNQNIRSYKDAQGFRYQDGTKFLAKQIPARIFHYGWARAESVMAKKIVAIDKLFHGDQKRDNQNYQYRREWGLKPFLQAHPQVMGSWIQANKNDEDFLNKGLHFRWKDLRLMASDTIENLTGWRMGEFKNFKEVK